jgi:phage shock protein PspC (stress-responsive transcriptional regulator)
MQPTTHIEQRQPLRRAREGRMIAGVCAGLADYFDVDVVLVRVVVAVLAIAAGVGVPLYLAAWLLVPDEDTEESIAEHLLGDVRRRGCCCAPTQLHHTDDGRDGQEGEGEDAKAS